MNSQLVSGKEPKAINGRGGTTEHPHAKKEILTWHSSQKLTQNVWVLSTKWKSITPRRYIGENLDYLGYRDDYDIISKAQSMKLLITWTSLKLKSILWKKMSKRMRRQATYWEKIFAKDIL